MIYLLLSWSLLVGLRELLWTLRSATFAHPKPPLLIQFHGLLAIASSFFLREPSPFFFFYLEPYEKLTEASGMIPLRFDVEISSEHMEVVFILLLRFQGLKIRFKKIPNENDARTLILTLIFWCEAQFYNRPHQSWSSTYCSWRIPFPSFAIIISWTATLSLMTCSVISNFFRAS